MDSFINKLTSYTPKPLGAQREYAVLLPLVYDQNQWHILYEIRSEHISQPGEVSFPGGAVEKDENFCDAAIRETMEELNLSKDNINILGEIDYIVNAKSTIRCFVGQLMIEDWRTINFNEEVARLFTIPLNELLEQPPKYYRLKTNVQPNTDFPFDRIRNGENYRFTHHYRSIPFYEINDENLWGLTAQLTHRFTEIVEELEQIKKPESLNWSLSSRQ